MAEIWIGEHLSLRMPIVVKVMKPKGDGIAEYVERFAREARAVARLRSPHVVSIIDYGADGGTPFIVMELLEGTDLLELLQRRPRLDPGEAVTLVDQVAKALGSAHAVGITHRDIKPRNLFLASSGEDVNVKVLDFGIAGMSASERITAADAVLGSPFYMSPEQLRSMPLDPQVDLWALAVVAFRLVTGELPFEGETVVEVCERIMRLERRRVPPTTPRAELLDSFFARAFAGSPAERFNSVKELAEAFRRIAGPAKPINHLLDIVPDAPTLESRHNAEIIDRIRQRRARHLDKETSTTSVTPVGRPDDGEDTAPDPPDYAVDDAPTFVDELSTFVAADPDPEPEAPQLPPEATTTTKMTPRLVAPGIAPPTFGPPPSQPPLSRPGSFRSSVAPGFEDSTDVRRQMGVGPPAWQLLAGFVALVLLATLVVYAVIR